MCGRVVTTTPLSVLAEQLEAKVADSEAARVEPSWNAAPTALLPVLAEARSDHTRRIGYLRWGLVPW